MKKLIVFLVIIVVSVVSCTKENTLSINGGTIRMCLNGTPFTYTSYEASDYNSSVVIRQVMEGLVSINPKSLKIQPQLATDWSIGEDGKSYVFQLRKGVTFHGDTEENTPSFSSEDVLSTFEKICSKTEEGLPTYAYEHIFKHLIVGAEDFYTGKTSSIEGIQIGKNEVTFSLIHRDENFLYKLGGIHAFIHSKKLLDSKKRGEFIGTGPFMYASEGGENGVPKMVLVRNPHYYEKDEGGLQLPYLDSVVFIVQPQKLEQLNMFENHQLDLILGLPTSRITKMLDGRLKDFNSTPPKLFLHKNPLLSTNYYFFNMQDERFKDPRVRKAFNLAIDKKRIGRDVLKNQYNELGNFGIVPPIPSIFRGYRFNLVEEEGYVQNAEQAKKLLGEAGYPNGDGFGPVNLRFNIGDINSAVADDFSKQIKQVLGINVNLDGSSFEQLYNDASSLKGDIFRSAWIGDYPNPETFLHNFYGKLVPEDSLTPSPVNQSRYQNPEFDSYYEQAMQSDRAITAMQYAAKAEAELMRNPPIIPLWYSGDLQIVYSNVRNLHFNALAIFDFKAVYKKEWTEDEYLKNLEKNNPKY